MISMKTTTDLQVDFGWIGSIPTDDNRPESGEASAHVAFFAYCIQCDRWCDNHQTKCVSEAELIALYRLYAARLTHCLPFTPHEEDFKTLAAHTWKDPEYQAARDKRTNKAKRQSTGKRPL